MWNERVRIYDISKVHNNFPFDGPKSRAHQIINQGFSIHMYPSGRFDVCVSGKEKFGWKKDEKVHKKWILLRVWFTFSTF